MSYTQLFSSSTGIIHFCKTCFYVCFVFNFYYSVVALKHGQFLLHSKVNLLSVYIYPFLLGFPSHWGHHRAPGRVPCVHSTLLVICFMGFPGGTVGKNLPAIAGDLGLIPGSGISPGVGNGNLLQHSCLGKSRGKRRLVVYSPLGSQE